MIDEVQLFANLKDVRLQKRGVIFWHVLKIIQRL